MQLESPKIGFNPGNTVNKTSAVKYRNEPSQKFNRSLKFLIIPRNFGFLSEVLIKNCFEIVVDPKFRGELPNLRVNVPGYLATEILSEMKFLPKIRN
jgi:hypothetical protein